MRRLLHTTPGSCWLRALLAGLLALAAGLAQAQATAAMDYARSPQLSGFVVSPSNQHAAFLMIADNGRSVAAVIALERPGAVQVVGSIQDADVTRVAWVNDRRLVYEAYEPGAMIDPNGAGTFAVDIDGKRSRQLITWRSDNEATGSRLRTRMLTYGWFFWRPWDGRGDEVLVYRRVASGSDGMEGRAISRLDTVTQAMTNLSFDLPPHASSWTFDAQGDLRLVGSTRNGLSKLFMRASGQDRWVEIESNPALGDRVLQPLYIEGDDTVIVLSQRGRDTAALYTYEPRTQTLSADPLAAVGGFDIGGSIEFDRQARQVVGVHLQTDRELSVWFDPALVAIQRAIDAALPEGRVNRLVCGNCLSAERLVVRSGSDRVPAEYFVYDRKLSRLTRLGASHPWLPEASQGRRSFHRVAARDGLSLPVVLTHPAGKEAARDLPAVVLVHGGPWVRGTDLAWSAEAQFLASRGYRVIQVDYRGSTGLGQKHFEAGWKQWGLAMQDDLADVVDWAVREGRVDAKRVCIAGSSYGGYAALMGPVRHPGLYRCAASYAGVTELALQFSGEGTDISLQHRRYVMPTLIGDPVADAERLRQTSPLHRVAEIKVPVLLAQGALDRRVTPAHADRFEAAARAAGLPVERVDYAQEAHSWFSAENHADYLQRLEKLLARTLAP